MAVATKTIQRIAAALLALALLPGTLPALAQQGSPIRDQDRTVFKTVYGEKLTSVKRTRATADDLSLAEEMMAFALDVPDDPGVQCLIYIDVIELASNGSDLELLRKTVGLLQAHWPAQDAVSPEQLMQLASRSYRGVERRDREVQGEHYIALLLDIADQYRAADPDQAMSVYRLASTVARTIESDQFDPIQEQIKRLSAASQIAKRIEMLELSVKKNPQNSPAAHELVRLLLTQHQDVAKASRYVQSTNDEELIDLVGHCAKGIEQANAATAMRIADWHLNLAEDEADEQALALLQQARRWYARFFSLYPRDDALAKRVVEMDALAKLKIQSLTQDSPDRAATDNSKWKPLTAPPFDVKDHVIYTPKTAESNDRGEILIDDGMFAVPLPKSNSYEVRITLTTPEPKEEYEKRSINIDLPVGDDYFFGTRHFVKGGIVAELAHVEEKLRIEDEPDRTGKKVQYTLQLSQTDDQTAIAVLHNGRLAASWKGILEQLEERDEDDIRYLPKEKGHVMIFHGMTPVRIHSIEYRKRD